MPNKKALNPHVAQEAEDTILRESEQILSLDERTALRAMFTSAAFKKALHNARLSKPSEFAGPAALNSALGSIIANNRLHQMQGWRMFEIALGKQVEDPKPTPTRVEDDYLRER